MPITIGAKRRWTVLIIVKESTVSQSPGFGAGRGVWGEGAAIEPLAPLSIVETSETTFVHA